MSSEFSSLLSSSTKILSSAQQSKSQFGFGNGNAENNTLSSFSGGNSTMTPAFQRSLKELSAASAHLGQSSSKSSSSSNKRLLEDTSMQTTRNYEASAQRLLAREGGGFDTARLGRSARQLELMSSIPATSTPAKQDNASAEMARTPYGVRSGLLTSTSGEDGGIPLLGATGVGGDVLSSASEDIHVKDLEQYLKRRNDQIISSILTKQRQITFQTADNLIRKRKERAFQQESETILRDLTGYRIHDHDADEIQLNLPANLMTDSINDSDSMIIGSTLSSSNNAISNSSTSIAAAYGAGSQLSESARRHATIVATHNSNLHASNVRSMQSTGNNPATLDLLNDMHKLAYSLNSSSANPENTAYLNSIKLLQSVYQHESGGTTSHHNKSTSSYDTIVKSRAEGTLSYLCHQFRSHLMDRVRTAALSGHTFQSASKSPNLSGFAKDVLSFVELEMGLGLNQSSIASALLWPKLYICLRCGDAASALEILKFTNSNESEQQILLSLLEPMATHQFNLGKSCLWDNPKTNSSNSSIPANISTTLSQSLADVYQRAKARSSSASVSSSSSSMDRYKLAVLALLSLVETPQSILSISGIVNTIEDYLFCTLWDAVQIIEPASVLPSSYGTQTTALGQPLTNIPGSSSSSSSSCSDKIKKLGKLVKHWGPEYFQAENDMSGWAYGMPLLAAQQFQSAIVHLADVGSQRKNGLIHATHLGIALDSSNIDMLDLGVTDEKSGKDASSMLLKNLLTSYSSTFQNIDPEASLEYLVRVPSASESGMGTMNIGNETRNQVSFFFLNYVKAFGS